MCLVFFVNSGKWELGELETDGALDGDIGLVMSVRGPPSFPPLTLCVYSFMFQFLVSIYSKLPSTMPSLPSWIDLSAFRAQRL